jgi:rhodanese-related sulfurtransferase
MRVNTDLARLKEYFELKLLSLKQLADVVDSVRNGDPDLILLDMRDRDDYHRGHIKGALSMPLDDIDKRYRDLPRDNEIVTYCYNQYCHLSTLGALKLVEHGIPAKEMNVGWSEWVKLGNPLHEASQGSGECNDHCELATQRNITSGG